MMPSTQPRRRLLGILLLLCVCTQSAAGAIATPRPEAADTGCFPGVDRIESGEAVGDVVELEMLLCFSGSITVSGPGYTANASLGNGNWSGSVTLRFDTRLNGSDALGVTTYRSHSVAMNATGNGSFEPGTYTVTVRDGGGDVVETAEFTLGRPRARDLTVFEAPEGAAGDLQSLAAVHDAKTRSPTDSSRRLNDPNTSEHLSLATNETLIVAVRAEGLEGAMAAGTGTPLSRFRAAVDAAGGDFVLRQTDETVTTQREPLTPALLNSSATHLVQDPANDTYYLVVDTRKLWGEWGGSHGSLVNVGARPGMGYAIRFSMQEEIDGASPPADLVAADFHVVEAAVAGTGDEPPKLPPEENVSLRVPTTLAAGTSVVARVTGHPNGPLEQQVRVRRFGDGAGVMLDLNLSGVPNGTTLSVTLERDGEPVDGEFAVVSRSAAPAEEREMEPTQTRTATHSATQTESSQETSPSPTRRDVPGFGGLSGVVGLLLTALALRQAAR